MTATLPVNDSLVFLGSAAASGGVFTSNAYPTTAGKVGVVLSLALGFDPANNLGSVKASYTAWKNVSGTATQVGSLAILINNAGFSSSQAYTHTTSTAQVTFTNSSAANCDVAHCVQSWEAA